MFCTVVLIKGNIAHANMHTAAGAYVIKDLTTERDAFIVARLEEQDAIILGKANLSEWVQILWLNFLEMDFPFWEGRPSIPSDHMMLEVPVLVQQLRQVWVFPQFLSEQRQVVL